MPTQYLNLHIICDSNDIESKIKLRDKSYHTGNFWRKKKFVGRRMSQKLSQHQNLNTEYIYRYNIPTIHTNSDPT